MKVRRHRSLGGGLIYNAFPDQARVFEVQQQRELQAGDVEVAEHLRGMRVVKGGDDLRINDHELVNNQIRDQIADQRASVRNRKDTFCRYGSATSLEFDNHRALIKLLIQSGL